MIENRITYLKMEQYALIITLVALLGCVRTSSDNAQKEYAIIPKPVELIAKKGSYEFGQDISLSLIGFEVEAADVKDAVMIHLKSLEDLEVVSSEADIDADLIIEKQDLENGKEAYSLHVSPDKIHISAEGLSGVFYALQSMIQLYDVGSRSIPAVEINDYPRFGYRGMHLDVARHFFDVEVVKEYLDLMALYKLNRFHWHLTEDQGWRIEIKKYPKLTEIGAYRDGTLIGHYNDQPHQFDNKRYGGFYTQEEIKEIVAYARERCITVIPEIELPGHAQAAIAAYPELGCTDEQLEVMQLWGVSNNVYCPNEETFEFLENVLDEVMALFPSEYIHIGGDECPKVRWEESAFCQDLMRREGLKDEHELQSYFIQRIERYINANGKKIIGWDEILEGGLAPNATVMSWRGEEGGIAAVKAGHEAIMTPTSHCYFDYYQSDHPDEPLAIGGLLPLKKVFEYEPIPGELNGEEAQRILGSQANLWTEYIPTKEKLDYMAFPRLCALAERVWSPKNDRDFKDFLDRLQSNLTLLESKGVKYANHLYELKADFVVEDGQVKLAFSQLLDDAQIHYTINGQEPTENSLRYNTPIVMNQSGRIRAQAFKSGLKEGRPWHGEIHLHKAAGKDIELTYQPSEKYGGEDKMAGNRVFNGVLGSSERYGDAEWLGFNGDDFEATVDLGEKVELSSVKLRFFKGEGQWIYLPTVAEIYTSSDGQTFELYKSNEQIVEDGKIGEMTIPLDGLSTRYLRVVAKNYGIIPSGQQGGGNPTWLFVDEVIVM